MDYYLYKLRFDGAVHFGASDSSLSLSSAADSFCADTLFSALCHSANALWGSAGVDALCDEVRSGRLKLSDGMPWRECWSGDVYYIPRPCAVSDVKRDVPAALRKTIKQMRWLAVDDIKAFTASLHGEGLFRPEAVSFGVTGQRGCAAVPDGQDARPYQVGTYHFFPDCGLYFLAECASEAQHDRLCRLLEALGPGGMGGKTSAGYGSFCLDDTIYLNEPFDFQTQWFFDGLTGRHSGQYLLLTSSLPKDDELDDALDGALYQLIRRGGFVSSDAFADSPLKKDTQYFIAAGAVLKKTFTGDLYQVGHGGRHPVYRYSLPLMLGVTL